MQKDERKDGEKSIKKKGKTMEKNFGLHNGLYLRQVGGGIQKGIEAHELLHSSIPTLSTSSDFTLQLLYPIYLSFLFHNKAVLGQKVIFSL